MRDDHRWGFLTHIDGEPSALLKMSVVSFRKQGILALVLSLILFSLWMNLKSTILVADCEQRALPTDLPAIREKRPHSNTSCQGICDCLRSELTAINDLHSASSAWRHHAKSILGASVNLDETENKQTEFNDWVEYLFSWTTLSRLQKSVETMPQDPDGVQSLLRILEERWLSDSDRPLKIAVFGGSLTAGHGCLDNPLGLPTKSFLKRQIPCAWPARLQHLLDTFLPSGLVNITNMAMAATTSDVGATVLEYQLWPPELLPDGPDLLIAAFSTNDALAEAPESEIYQNMQLLIQAVQREQNCNSARNRLPMLLYIDDFIAWPGSIQKWLDFHHDLHELAEWHGFGFLSYANAFRDVVQANLMTENNFKGGWKYEKRKFVANPHPGMSFHIVMTWLVAYYFLSFALHVCDGTLLSKDPASGANADYKIASLPNIPRPPLTPDLLTEEIPERWQEKAEEEKIRCESLASSGDSVNSRCGFVWVANRVSEFRSAAAIEQFLQPFLKSNENWKAEGNSYRSKHGWVAKAAGAKFVLRVPNLAGDVQFLTILALKSYGDEWQNTKLQIRTKGKEFEVVGFHNSTTSVIIPHKFALDDIASKGSDLELEFSLIGGSTFKITGMAFCSQ